VLLNGWPYSQTEALTGGVHPSCRRFNGTWPAVPSHQLQRSKEVGFKRLKRGLDANDAKNRLRFTAGFHETMETILHKERKRAF
jgi:hypothetical protein